MNNFRRFASVIAVVAVSTSSLSGCAQPSAPIPQQSVKPSTDSYPLTIENCGTALTLPAPPQRVIAIKSTAIEMLLALGLEDTIVGTAFADGPPSDLWADRAVNIPIISERLPGLEAALSYEPDFIYAGWESNLSFDGAAHREQLHALGIGTFVSPSACEQSAEEREPLQFSDIFTEVLDTGTLFAAESAAEEVVADLQTRLAALNPDKRGLSAVWYSSGSDVPFVGAGLGAPQMILDAAGLANIAEDVPDSWSSMSWEAVIDANPDVIVLADSAWGSAEKKIQVLQSNPATARLDAVIHNRYLEVPFPTTEAGVRNVEAVELLLEQLAALPAL